MKIFFLFVYLAQLSSSASINDEIENVYVDALIQRYKVLSANLWKFVREKSNSQPYVAVNEIITKHQAFFMDRNLEELLFNNFRLKFQFYYETKSFKNCSQEELFVNLLDELNVPSHIKEKLISTDNHIYCVDGVTSFYRKKAKKTSDLFGLISEDSDASSCNHRSTKVIDSASQNIFMFYQILSASLLIQYATEQRFSMVAAVRDGFDETNIDDLRDTFNYKYRRIADRAGEYLKIANRDVWMCDLVFYTKNDTTIQITNFLRDYKTARQHGCYEGTFCHQQRNAGRKDTTCPGQIFDCTFVESDMKICLSSTNNTRRRYDYIEYDSGRRFGRESCGTNRVEVESWWKYFVFPCDYCFCYCEESSKNSNRSFSLHSVVSDIRSNKIITGVGITSKNGIFSWTISQSVLLSDGRVQQVKEMNYEEANAIGEEDDELVINDEFQDISNEIDYYTMTWRSRAVDLATITAPPGSVLTGIRFAVVNDHLSFEIRATQFDFNSGRLDGRSEWISDKVERSVLLLDRPEPSYPIYTNDYECLRSIPYPTPNKFVKFRPSDPDKDAGQTTVPFIDTQMVRPMHLTLLSGVGIYYKYYYSPGFGGFIAPKLVVYDMSAYLGV
ncbi:uncharacterized protein LOC119066426 isoform X2 [Bradysia coprophila]|uniref:uncharacterized protein LOC119066426 isoform X2 n=1 Tax=Bradysia coprophila TaxID=38358 RepID=UPI00187DC51F|nr:uncharacterized protein LOC119066426 isoform X2 [Bradysia coprophila]